MRVIKSLVVSASNEKDASEVANRLAEKLTSMLAMGIQVQRW